jgi:hypothetical protein
MPTLTAGSKQAGIVSGAVLDRLVHLHTVPVDRELQFGQQRMLEPRLNTKLIVAV